MIEVITASSFARISCVAWMLLRQIKPDIFQLSIYFIAHHNNGSVPFQSITAFFHLKKQNILMETIQQLDFLCVAASKSYQSIFDFSTCHKAILQNAFLGKFRNLKLTLFLCNVPVVGLNHRLLDLSNFLHINL